LTLTVEQLFSCESSAKVRPTEHVFFLCHNLASANTSADPYNPRRAIIGEYWQRGRKGPDSTQWLSSNSTNSASGPTGPDAGDTNDGTVSGFPGSVAANGSWSEDTKTANDLCRSGYRIPTQVDWNGGVANFPRLSSANGATMPPTTRADVSSD
jgi:hypothetical protein